MPNKDVSRSQGVELKPVVTVQHAVNTKSPSVSIKTSSGKAVVKDTAMSPTGTTSTENERIELLGSLTTEQQQRTSARVIKKLKLEPLADREKRAKRPDGQTDDITECETPNKLDDKELKFPTVKQRMPKALWSTDEKNLFFEALNEYGKDFDAITTYICAKMKKKGMPDVNLKTKTQVSHFYYRTWHKLSKHVRFDENVKKVAQELYALINYGELRKKLVSVSEKTCARLGEMVRGGALVVRARGRNMRVRTPMCRALRRLNQINELACGPRVCTRVQVCLRARSRAAWSRVQAAAHNPRAALHAPLRARLADLLLALQRRWRTGPYYKPERIDSIDKCSEEIPSRDDDSYPEMQRPCPDEEDNEIPNHLNLETDRTIVQEDKLARKLVLHVGPGPAAEVHLPVVSPSEQLSSQKICFSSYLERMGSQRRDNDLSAKIRTTKRQRKDSGAEKDKELEQKKLKTEEDINRLMHIDETAIDGIDLMASYRLQEEEEKPSTEDEKEIKSEETAEDETEREPERDKDMSEKEKDSFSEMEDDEKYNKSDTDNESDGKGEKSGKNRKFKNLKVKFRIRPKKRGGSIYTLVFEKDRADEGKIDDTLKEDETKNDEPKVDEKSDELKSDEPKVEELKAEEPKAEEPKADEPKPVFDVDMALRQIRKGWSIYDAGDLTIGDLYLMFGSRSRLELDYWWAEPTPPLPQPLHKKTESPATADKHVERKADKTPDKGTDSSVEDERDRARESDTDIFSPKNTFSQDSNDGMSGDERKKWLDNFCPGEQLASPEHKSSSGGCGTLKLVSKLINRPLAPTTPTKDDGFALLGDRLKRLLALAGNPVAAAGGGLARCHCGHVCPAHRRQPRAAAAAGAAVFRHPAPIAPRPEPQPPPPGVSLSGVPRWRRGRPRPADRRVVVQRLLPLLPKLPPPSNLIPVKIVPNSPPAPPRILPKPPPTTTSDLSLFYVLSESNGQFYFHDGDRRIPITSLHGTNGTELHAAEEESNQEEESAEVKAECSTVSTSSIDDKSSVTVVNASCIQKTESSDMAQFLPSESLSLSPSRLLRESEGWLEGAAQDFSLSSFLAHLDERPPPGLAVESQLQSLMAESSVDYVAKFADLAAEVTDEAAPCPGITSLDLDNK